MLGSSQMGTPHRGRILRFSGKRSNRMTKKI